MRLTIVLPRTAKQEKALAIARAVYAADPGDEKRAIRKALKKLRQARKAA